MVVTREIRRFMLFHEKSYPATIKVSEIEDFYSIYPHSFSL